MKKLLCVIIAIIVCLCFTACKSSSAPPLLEPSDKQEPPISSDVDPAAEQKPLLEPVIEVDDSLLKKLVTFVAPFNILPQEFTDSSELSDYTLFFTAVTRMNSDFQPLPDGYSYSLSLSKLNTAVSDFFGKGTALSESYLTQNYEPYIIDSANSVVIKTSMGSITSFLYPYRCTKTDDGYELYMLNLLDPLFIAKYPEHSDGADASEVDNSMVADIADNMMTYVYTITKNSDGFLNLTAFRYLNSKDIQMALS
ncbi:MAG: hypothetical protein RSG53_02145 [Oscillospiraceae bacterium]